MLKKFLLLLLLLIPTNVFAASNTSHKKFTVKNIEVKHLYDLINKSHVNMFKATKTYIIKDLGNNKREVEKRTAKGNFKFVIETKTDIKDDATTITNTLISSSSNLKKHQTIITLKKLPKKKVEVKINITSEVNDPNINDLDMFIDAKSSLNRLKDTIEDLPGNLLLD